MTKNDDNASQIKLDVCPEDEIGYELLVSFLITVDGTKNWVTSILKVHQKLKNLGRL